MDRVATIIEKCSSQEQGAAETLPAIQPKMSEIRGALKDRGRLVVRYSGTEPLLRVMSGGDDACRNEQLIEDLIQTIREHLS